MQTWHAWPAECARLRVCAAEGVCGLPEMYVRGSTVARVNGTPVSSK